MMARQYMAIMKLGFMPAKLRKLETVSLSTAPAAMSTATKIKSCTDRPSFFVEAATVRFWAATLFDMILIPFLAGFPPVIARPRAFGLPATNANEALQPAGASKAGLAAMATRRAPWLRVSAK